MKLLKQLISAVVLSILASTAVAQTEETSGNIVGGTWNGTVTNTTVTPGDGSHTQSSGPTPIYNPDTNTIIFSYDQLTVNQIIGINTALSNSGSGLRISGYNYSWQYYNQDFNRGTLSSTISLTNAANTSILEQYSYSMSQTTNGWTQFSGSETFGNIYDLTQAGSLSISFTGISDRFWAGYYGPMVRDVDVRLRYTVTPVDPCASDPQSSPVCPGYKTFYTIPDDGHAIVPIPFGFPLYGQIFTHSIFFDNGAVSFYSPNHTQRLGGGGLSMPTLSESMSSSFFYTIIPLKTDLIANGGQHYTQGDLNYLRYTWEDVSQFGRWDSRNTFSLEIRPTGYIGLQYDKINIQGSWTSAIIGNASLGEYQLIDSSSSTTTTSINSWSVNETTATDCSDPLTHINCPGYREAYFSQQCNADQLYSSECPGYSIAYAMKYIINADPVNSSNNFETTIVQEQVPTLANNETSTVQEQVSTPLSNDTTTVQEQELTSTSAEIAVVQETVSGKETETNVLRDLVIAQLLVDQTNSTDLEVELIEDKENQISLESLLSAPAPTPQPTSATASSNTRESTNAAPTTTREAIAQQRQAAAREQAAQEAREDPEGTAEAMDSAESMEQQVELQNAVLGAMSFVPGFDAYGRATLPDAAGYAPFEIYRGQQNIDTPAARSLLGGSDKLHQEMVNEQWRR